jgi:hypothetical protein
MCIFSLCSLQLGEREDKGKFTLLHPGGAATKLRADTQQEAENWVNIIAASIKRVRFLLVAVLFSCQIDCFYHRAVMAGQRRRNSGATCCRTHVLALLIQIN